MAFVGSCVEDWGQTLQLGLKNYFKEVEVELKTIPLYYRRLLLNLGGLHLEGHILRMLRYDMLISLPVY